LPPLGFFGCRWQEFFPTISAVKAWKLLFCVHDEAESEMGMMARQQREYRLNSASDIVNAKETQVSNVDVARRKKKVKDKPL